MRARLDTVIDDTIGDGIDRLIAERALDRDHMPESDVDEIRRQMEDAQARRLQPHYIQAFFATAFERLGGSMKRREAGRFEITHVPPTVRDYDRQSGVGATVLTRYERVCFEKERAHPAGGVPAQLLAPGHPLLDAVVEKTVTDCAPALREGAVLVDAHDPGQVPRLLVAINEQIADGGSPTVSKRFSFVELDPSGGARTAGPAPYLDYRGLTGDEAHLAASLFDEDWLKHGVEDVAVAWAVENSLAAHAAEVRRRITHQVARVRMEVISRLTGEINRWDAESAKLRDWEAAGRQLRMRPETAERRARDLEARLVKRLAQLDADESLIVLPPVVAGAALVVPQGLLDKPPGPARPRWRCSRATPGPWSAGPSTP